MSRTHRISFLSALSILVLPLSLFAAGCASSSNALSAMPARSTCDRMNTTSGPCVPTDRPGNGSNAGSASEIAASKSMGRYSMDRQSSAPMHIESARPEPAPRPMPPPRPMSH